MRRAVFYAVAAALHVVVLFGIAAPALHPPPPKDKRKYVEVTLSAPPPPLVEIAPVPLPPQPVAPVPEPQPEPPPQVTPLPETPPEPQPPPPPPLTPPPAENVALPAPEAVVVMPVPVVQSRPTPLPATTAAPLAAPVAVPEKYLGVSQPSFVSRVEPDYPIQARRLHQQGAVVLGLYINEFGSLDKIEIVKSSGYPALDAAAVAAMRESHFRSAYNDKTPEPSHAEIAITFQLQ